MARKVILKSKTPLKVGEKWICRCGLSKKWNEEDPQPFCDGSHKKFSDEDENKVYNYNENLEVVSIE